MADNSRNGSNQPGSSGSYNCPTCGRDYCYSCNLDFTIRYGGPSNATIDSSASTATFSWPVLSGIQMDPRSVAPINPPPPRTQPQTIAAPRNPPRVSSSLHRSIPPQVMSSTRGAAAPSMSLPRGLAPVPDPTTPQLPSSSRPAYLPAGGSIAGPSQHVPKYACSTCGSTLEGLDVDATCSFCKCYFRSRYRGAGPSNTTIDSSASIAKQTRMENINRSRNDRMQSVGPYSGNKRDAFTLPLPGPTGLGNHNFRGIAGRGRGSIASSAGPSSTNPWPHVEPNRYRHCCKCHRILSGLDCVRCPWCSTFNWM